MVDKTSNIKGTIGRLPNSKKEYPMDCKKLLVEHFFSHQDKQYANIERSAFNNSGDVTKYLLEIIKRRLLKISQKLILLDDKIKYL